MRLYTYRTPRCPVLPRLRAHPIPIPMSSSLIMDVRRGWVLWWLYKQSIGIFGNSLVEKK